MENGGYWHRQEHEDLKRDVRNLSQQIEDTVHKLDSIKLSREERLALQSAAAKLTTDTAVADARHRLVWWRQPEVLIPTISSAVVGIVAILSLLHIL